MNKNYNISFESLIKGFSFTLIISLVLLGCHQTSQTSPQKNDTTNNQHIVESTDVLLYENDTIAIYQIDSVSFHHHYKEASHKKDTIPYISDISKAKELLDGQITFGGWNQEKNMIDSTQEGEMIALIQLKNGKTISPNEQNLFWDIYFQRYYPTEHILLFEGGHSSDFSIDLQQGIIDVEKVGNPDYIVYSPSTKYRLNGWFPGQECSEYFIQAKNKIGYKFHAKIPIHLTSRQFDLCTIGEIFWKSDDELYFKNIYYGTNEDERLGFFKLTIKEPK